MGNTAREFVVTQERWQVALIQAKALDAYRQQPVGSYPYVWGVKGNVLLRWYDYAMGRITGEETGNARIRCTLLILGCTGEIKNPVAYARLKEQFFSELLEQPVGDE
ncbi:MAG: hypothetical protein ACE5JD_16545 [Candidatus Methylomirabilia bacterium]